MSEILFFTYGSALMGNLARTIQSPADTRAVKYVEIYKQITR